MRFSTTEKKITKSSLAGICLGVAALIACELPLVLAVIGFGTLSTVASALSPPFWLEIVGICAAIFGVLLILGVAIRRILAKNQRESE